MGPLHLTLPKSECAGKVGARGSGCPRRLQAPHREGRAEQNLGRPRRGPGRLGVQGRDAPAEALGAWVSRAGTPPQRPRPCGVWGLSD